MDQPARPVPPAQTTEPKDAGADASFTLEVGPNSDGFGQLKRQVTYWANKGRYQKVRIKRAGKPILPDIPVGALIAVEAATFFWAGLLRAAIVNVVGRTLFEVELINEAEGSYRTGLEHFLSGELDDAEKLFGEALRIDERFAKAHLQMGVLQKMRGKKSLAKRHFEEAVQHDPHSDAAKEARVHLEKLAK
jgi:tetratricopeptide (TPR) repeat protein